MYESPTYEPLVTWLVLSQKFSPRDVVDTKRTQESIGTRHPLGISVPNLKSTLHRHSHRINTTCDTYNDYSLVASPTRSDAIDDVKSSMRRLSYDQLRSTASISRWIAINLYLVILASLSLLNIIFIANAQRLYPNVCQYDDLEIICKSPIGMNGVPHTLGPNTKRMIINNAQTTQLVGIDYLKKLETLDLAYNRIASIEFGEISKNTMLTSLNTSHNAITELRDSESASIIARISPDAGELNINNELRNLKRMMKEGKINLVELMISHNQLTRIRNYTFIRMHRLVTLDLSNNQISTLEPQAFLGLNKLETLNLRSNRLMSVPTSALQSTMQKYDAIVSSVSGVSDLRSSIVSLSLGNNPIVSLEGYAFDLLTRAQELYLDSCGISDINEQAFQGLHTLNMLSLSNNNITKVPRHSFSYLGMLRALRLNANPLSRIEPDSFINLVNLEVLEMNNGSLSSLLVGTFHGLDQLTKLEISNNKNLKFIERGAFEPLKMLTSLKLSNNSLASVPDDLAHHTKSLARLDLRNNPLYCACDLKWLTKWLKKLNGTMSSALSHQNHNQLPLQLALNTDNSVNDSEQHMANILNLTCANPPALSGKLVIELPDNKLECLEPSSDVNVRLGYAMLFIMTFMLTFVCMINACRGRRLFVMLKHNIAQNQHLSMMMPYNLPKAAHDDDNHVYGMDQYEPVAYEQQSQIYAVPGSDQFVYYTPQYAQMYM